MNPTFKSLYVIFKFNGSISFNKIKNFGFLRYNRGKTYILDNKYEISFGDFSGSAEYIDSKEIEDLSSFISRNKDLIEKILDSKENEKFIEELN